MRRRSAPIRDELEQLRVQKRAAKPLVQQRKDADIALVKARRCVTTKKALLEEEKAKLQEPLRALLSETMFLERFFDLLSITNQTAPCEWEAAAKSS